MRRMIITSSLLLAMSATAMASQVYKWVDAKGVTHFSAQPPQGQEATSVNTATPQPKTAAEVEKPTEPTFESISDPEQAAIDAKVKQEVAAKETERKKYCEDVRTTLAQLENNPRVRMDVDGELRRLNEKERQARISDAQKSIAENCK